MQRAHPRLTIGILELLVKLGIVKGAQVYVTRLGNYFQLYVVGYALTCYSCYHSVEPCENTLYKVINEICDKKEYNRLKLMHHILYYAAGLRSLANKCGYLVEYILRNICAYNRESTVKHAEHCHTNEHCGGCRPDESDYVKQSEEEAAHLCKIIPRVVGELIWTGDAIIELLHSWGHSKACHIFSPFHR